MIQVFNCEHGFECKRTTAPYQAKMSEERDAERAFYYKSHATFHSLEKNQVFSTLAWSRAQDVNSQFVHVTRPRR